MECYNKMALLKQKLGQNINIPENIKTMKTNKSEPVLNNEKQISN